MYQFPEIRWCLLHVASHRFSRCLLHPFCLFIVAPWTSRATRVAPCGTHETCFEIRRNGGGFTWFYHDFTMFYHHGFTSVYSTPSSNQTAPLENPHWRILGGIYQQTMFDSWQMILNDRWELVLYISLYLREEKAIEGSNKVAFSMEICLVPPGRRAIKPGLAEHHQQVLNGTTSRGNQPVTLRSLICWYVVIIHKNWSICLLFKRIL